MTFSMKQVLSGSEILVGVLEEALKAGADSIRLEYEDTGLGVNFFSGELGSLVGIVPRDREQDVLASLIEKAGMVTKAHGEITIQLHGSEHVIDVKEFDSFEMNNFSGLCMKIKAATASEDELDSDSTSLFNSLTQRAFRGEL